MPMERAPFGCLTTEPPGYMITPMLKCVTPDKSPRVEQQRNKKEEVTNPSKAHYFFCGANGTRTRDLLRDRQAF